MNPEQDPALRASAEESQDQRDTVEQQYRAARSAPAGRDSYAVNGNVVSGSTGRGDLVGGNKSNKVAINFGAIAVIVGIVIGAVFIGNQVAQNNAGPSAATITKDSTCADYLAQDAATRDAAVKRVGLELGVRGVGSPLMLPEVDYECGNSPTLPFGTVVGRQRGY